MILELGIGGNIPTVQGRFVVGKSGFIVIRRLVKVGEDVESAEPHERVAGGRVVEVIPEDREVHFTKISKGFFGATSEHERLVMIADDVVGESNVVGPIFAIK